ncbi:MAG: hypothetical protein PVF95_03990 [bacterium]|jgi:uncharacterized repeat protein (TIGR04138 family)
MAQNDILEQIEKIVSDDERYRIEAYVFIMHALDMAVSRKARKGHVSGEELLESVRDYGRHLFGPTAKMVFEHWGVNETADFGNIVFNLVGAGILNTSDTDSPEDFAAVYDFDEVFDREYDWKIEDPL